MSEERTEWRPTPGPQERFLQSPAFEALYGGAAGGGKTDALLAEALRQIDNPSYRSLFFRRTFPELEGSLGAIERSKELYRVFGGVYSDSRHVWRFPSGSAFSFGHLQYEDDVDKFQSKQVALLIFDELTHFLERQYLYLFSRVRTPKGTGLRCYVRAGTNPGGVGHSWVKRRWAAWLDSEHPNPARPGELRWYAMVDDQDTEVDRHYPGALSRTFIPARLSDNPYLSGTDYEARLNAIGLVDRRRLLHGDWNIMPGAGLVFQRGWFEIVPTRPAEISKRVRYWELAATEKKGARSDPDYTAGTRASSGDGQLAGRYFVEDVIRTRGRWQEIRQLIKQTAEIDGHDVEIGIEQEPGASGKSIVAQIVEMLAGWTVRGYPAQEDKLTRANPWAAQAEVGNVKLVAGAWNDQFLEELDFFPTRGIHDDQVDATSGAMGMLFGGSAWIRIDGETVNL